MLAWKSCLHPMEMQNVAVEIVPTINIIGMPPGDPFLVITSVYIVEVINLFSAENE